MLFGNILFCYFNVICHNLLSVNFSRSSVHAGHTAGVSYVPGVLVGVIPVKLKQGFSFFHSVLVRFTGIVGKNCNNQPQIDTDACLITASYTTYVI